MEFKHSSLLGAFVLGLMVASAFFLINNNATGFVVSEATNLGSIASPADTLRDDSFLLFDNKIIILVDNASITSYQNTGSMLPFLTNYSHGLRIRPHSESEVHVGDIVSFKQDNQILVHRVVRIEQENNRTYFVTKGDNSNKKDEKIEFKDIEWKIIGILY